MQTLLYPPVSSHLPKLEHVFVPSPSLEQGFLKVHLARDGPEPITKNLATLLSDLSVTGVCEVKQPSSSLQQSDMGIPNYLSIHYMSMCDHLSSRLLYT